MARSLKVAVIGAGVSGLVASRELRREGHRVVVFERSARLGGTWVYDPRVETDPLGLDPNREVVHSSMYRSLRTNLPRPLMSFSDYPFSEREEGDQRTFPCHAEVLAFLERFAGDFGLVELIRFEKDVVRLERGDGSCERWVVEWRSRVKGTESEEFDAVVVCNGKHTAPRTAEFPGMAKWPGKQVHSHNYRVPDPFQNQVVIIIGNGASAVDISREIASVAKEVHLSSRSPSVQASKLDKHDNIWQHGKIKYACEDGNVAFEDGLVVQADTILHCTGYNFSFPFLRTNGMVGVEDNRVGPLYKHVFPPKLCPWLSFVGIPSKVILFMALELQAKWVALVLSSKVSLPSEEEMLSQIEEYYRDMEENGVPKHHSHTLYPNEIEYMDFLAAQTGVPPMENRLKEMFRQCRNILVFFSSEVEGYRDEFDVNKIAV
ncbi:hypothetical protein NMG60_11023050 [Bertholletia excelsa]